MGTYSNLERTDYAFYLRTLAWRCSKERPKHIGMVKYQYILLLFSRQNKLFVLLLVMRWAGNVARIGEERGVYRVLLGKPEGRRPMGRPRRRWVNNIRMDLQEVGCGYTDWIGSAQDRDRWRTLVSAVMNLRIPWNAGNFLTSCKPVSFPRRTLHHGVSKLVMKDDGMPSIKKKQERCTYAQNNWREGQRNELNTRLPETKK